MMRRGGNHSSGRASSTAATARRSADSVARPGAQAHAGSQAAAATPATPANTSHETQSRAAYTIGSSFM